MSAATQNLPDFSSVRYQRDTERSRPQFLGLEQDLFRHLLVIEINDQSVELLLVDTRQSSFRIAGTIRGDAEAGQNSAQHVRRGIVARNQQCLKIHNFDRIGPSPSALRPARGGRSPSFGSGRTAGTRASLRRQRVGRAGIIYVCQHDIVFFVALSQKRCYFPQFLSRLLEHFDLFTKLGVFCLLLSQDLMNVLHTTPMLAM